jgi:hypothetical protein
MPNDVDRVQLLQEAVQRLHKCGALHLETVVVHEKFQNKTIWQGEVEVFKLNGHPRSTRCFAWIQHDGHSVRYVALLDSAGVTSPATAVRASIIFSIPKTDEGHTGLEGR